MALYCKVEVVRLKEKFLISKDGEVVNRFNHRVKPENEKVVQAIEEALKKK